MIEDRGWDTRSGFAAPRDPAVSRQLRRHAISFRNWPSTFATSRETVFKRKGRTQWKAAGNSAGALCE
jgi:hypothetical protein